MVFLIFVIPSPKVEAVAGVDDAALIILASLAAFGIAISAEQGIDAVGPWVTDQFEEYVSSVGDSLSNVWSKFRTGVSKAGELILDGFTLRYNSKFGEWLVDKFSLSDSSSVSIGDVPFSGQPWSANVEHQLSNNFWITPKQANVYFFSVGPKVCAAKVNGSGQGCSLRWTGATDSINLHISSSYNNIKYGMTSYSYYVANYNLPDFPDINSALLSLSNFLSGVSSPDFVISTGSISVPGVGDYDDDDGILIDGLGSWGDSLDDVLDHVGDLTDPNSTVVTDGDITYTISPESVLVDDLVDVGQLTTENSPGFFNGLPLVGGIPDIQFGSLWHYVTDWVSSMSGGLSLIGGIMFSLPFVAAFYALVVILLVLSLWRLLRSA